MASILIVDDEPQVARALGRLLRRSGFEVEMAASGEEALAKIGAFVPDVVISDFRMPGMDGAQLLAEVKKRLPLALRLILSGHADLRSILSSINEGEICRFLSKPWDDREILALLQKLLAERELLAILYQPFRALPAEAFQQESKLVVRLQRPGLPFSTEQIVSLISKFTGVLEQSQLDLVGGLLERHAGRISFVADVGASQQLTLEIPVEAPLAAGLAP
ncbi:MAG TPA: response regulator [Myxococcales bacterium]|nr:response regulator [Myxococcales bacterium]